MDVNGPGLSTGVQQDLREFYSTTCTDENRVCEVWMSGWVLSLDQQITKNITLINYGKNALIRFAVIAGEGVQSRRNLSIIIL